ncbi:MAG: hypothetical protein ACK5MA_10340 [Parachlamydiaceae bacterium]
MKKILYILFAVCLFTACSSDDDVKESDVDTTIFVEQWIMPSMDNVVIGYYENNSCSLLHEVGSLKISKPTKEIIIPSDISNVSIFFDYYDQMATKTITYKLNKQFPIKKHNKNSLIIDKTEYTEVSKTDKTQYPQRH